MEEERNMESTAPDRNSFPIPDNAIGEAAAKAAALTHAGLTEQQVKYVTCDPQIGHGPDHYDVKFVTGGMKYKYAVDLYDGSIQGRAVKDKAAKGKYVYEGDYHEHHATVSPQAATNPFETAQASQAATTPARNTQTVDPASQMTPTASQPVASTSAATGTEIDEQQALAIAMQHAGLTQADLIRYRVKLRDKHGSLLYRFKLKIVGYECEVDVDSRTGAVTKYHREIDTKN